MDLIQRQEFCLGKLNGRVKVSTQLHHTIFLKTVWACAQDCISLRRYVKFQFPASSGSQDSPPFCLICIFPAMNLKVKLYNVISTLK